MKFKSLLLSGITTITLAFILIACDSEPQTQESESEASPESEVENFENLEGEQLVQAIAWYQTSGEADALYHQAYNLGEMKLNEALEEETDKEPAVVLDIDETVLTNSRWDAEQIKQEESIPMNEFFKQEKSEAVPGAIDFLNYADNQDVEIYYVSDRDASLTEATANNLEKEGAPQANEEHVLLKEPDEEGKDGRFNDVAESHDILLFFGDNLDDFPGYNKDSQEERNKKVEEESNKFGNEYIILPNPMYGHWEDALYEYEDKEAEEKAKLRKEHIQTLE